MSEPHNIFSDIWMLREIFGHIKYKYIQNIGLVNKSFYQERGWIDSEESFYLAIDRGDIDFAQILWHKTQFYKYSDKIEIFIYCCKRGILWAIEDLLESVDPSTHGNYAICKASERGYLAVVERLLEDPRVDPSDNYNRAIRIASENGHLAVVEILLGDPRIDPSANNNYAIRRATLNGHLAIVERLKQDLRVNSFANDNYYSLLNLSIVGRFLRGQ
jgi:hypothetical protein